MTSKISYPKLIRRNIANRSWLATLSLIAFLILLPFTILLTLRDIFATRYDLQEVMDWALNRYAGNISGLGNIFTLLLLIFMGIFCAVSGFSYLHSREKQDFYHSLPVTRTSLFMVSYSSGLLIFVIPYLLYTLIVILIGAVNGFMTGDLLIQCIASFIHGLLLFLMIYHITVLGMVLTGETITGIMASFVLFFYVSGIIELFFSLCASYYQTWCYQSRAQISHLLLPFAPPHIIGNFIDYEGQAFVGGYNYVAALILLIVTLILSLYLNKRSPSETAGTALAFKKTGTPIKVLLVVPLAIAATFITEGIGATFNLWSIATSVLAICFFSGLIDYIYCRDLRLLHRGKWSTLFSGVLVLLILLIFPHTAGLYDDYLPKKDKIESMSFDTYSVSGYTDSYLVYPDILEHTHPLDYAIEDFEPLYDLVQKKISFSQDDILDTETVNTRVESVDVPTSSTIDICYTLKNGKKVYRNYNVWDADLETVLTTLCEDPKFREYIFPMITKDPSEISHLGLMDLENPYTLLDLNPQQKALLVEAYQKDFAQISIHDLAYSDPYGCLVATYIVNDDINFGENYEYYFYIYEGFDNTIARLEEFGIDYSGKPSVEDIQSMTYYRETDPEYYSIYLDPEDSPISNKTDSEIEVVDPDEIQAVIDNACHYYPNQFLSWSSREVDSEYVEITFTNGYSERYYICIPHTNTNPY